MQYEVKITFEDLKQIFILLLSRSNRFNLKLRKLKESERVYHLLQYDSKRDEVIIESVNDKRKEEISVSEVEYIEFETFYKYKSLEAKIFYLE